METKNTGGKFLPLPLQALTAVAAKQDRLTFASFELTSRCNLKCGMCYVRAEAGDRTRADAELSGEVWLDIARQALDAGVVTLLITGGEPLLHRDFQQIFSGVSRMGFVVGINTNAVLINAGWIDFFREYTPHRVNVSLYGASQATYERMCGVPEGYRLAVDGIDRLLNAGIGVSIRTTATAENMEDIPEILAFAKSRGIPVQCNPYAFPPMRRETGGDVPADRPDAQRVAELMVTTAERTKAPEVLKKMYERVRRIDPAAEVRFDKQSACSAGRSSMWITWDGRMLPCGLLEELSADVLNLGVTQSWKEILMCRDKMQFPDECCVCAYKNACFGCPALHRHETGSFQIKSSYVCNINKIYFKLLNSINSLY